MKLGATCLLCLLLTCMALPAAGRLRERSMEIRSKESRSKGTPPGSSLVPQPRGAASRFGQRCFAAAQHTIPSTPLSPGSLSFFPTCCASLP